MRSDRYKDDPTTKDNPAATEEKHAGGRANGGATGNAKVAAGDHHVAPQTRPRKKHRPLRVLLLLILLLAAAIAGMVAHSYKVTADALDVDFTEDKVSVEVGGEYSAMDYVSSATGEVTPSDEYLDADTIGVKEVVFTDTQPMYGGLLNPTREFTLSYEVVDSTDPLVLWSGDGTVLERGTEFDINNVIGYGDNADPKPECKVDGKVDMSTNGSYPLHVTVTDASGNSVDWDLTVKVADSVPVYTDDSPRTPFGDFASKYKGDGRSFGIDVSVWQGDIDWEKVKAAGCDFAFIRIGYSVDGEVTEDSKFAQNLKGARDAGVKVGVYLYSYDNTKDEARASAKWIRQRLGGQLLDLPVAFDWEDFGRFQTYEMSFADLNELYDVFADELAYGSSSNPETGDAENTDPEADTDGAGSETDGANAETDSSGSESTRYDCILYSSMNPLEKLWEDTDTRPVWLANYTDKTEYKGPYKVWQQSCTGRIDGIDADVDMDIMYK